MEHFEFLYVLHRAHIIRKFTEAAENQGEEIHVSDHFVPLTSGLQAQAQIRKINPTDKDPVLILRLRYKEALEKGAEKALTAAHVFFNKNYKLVPKVIHENGWMEHVFFSDDILKPITMDEIQQKTQ